LAFYFGGNLKKVKNFAERAKVKILRNAAAPKISFLKTEIEI
jgi:hypothetical protein